MAAAGVGATYREARSAAVTTFRVPLMHTTLDEYANAYESLRMERHDGVLQVTLHTGDGPLLMSPVSHRELPAAFADIANDDENLCVILTGTGEGFIPGRVGGSTSAGARSADGWYRVMREGTKLVTNLLDINVPVIAAVNGPCVRHSELVLLCDIVLAVPQTMFQDAPHFWNGLVPGDGVAQAWTAAIGPSRARYFLLTGQQIDARVAHQLGIVNEIVEPERLLSRAWELAREIVQRPPMTIRYTKMVIADQLRRTVNNEVGLTLALEAAAHIDAGGDLGLLAAHARLGDGTGFARPARDGGHASEGGA